ncbi:MAG: hypothetical protein LBS57_09535, partial [Treponema sp.]|nr:hypothetical protein [Treponema sp.]
SLFQNPVGFSQALAVSQAKALRNCVFKGCCSKTEVLEQPQVTKKKNHEPLEQGLSRFGFRDYSRKICLVSHEHDELLRR